MKYSRSILAAVTLSLGLIMSAQAAPINLATSGTATQSSTGTWDGLYASADLAIDGNTNGDYYAGHSVAHTLNNYEAWWMVDLGNTFSLSGVELWNRTDCCSERILPYRVSVLDSFLAEVWGQQYSLLPPVPQAINFASLVEGQFVRVQLVGTSDYLHLAEVKVFQQASPVSEPATFVLLGLGLVMLGAARKRAA